MSPAHARILALVLTALLVFPAAISLAAAVSPEGDGGIVAHPGTSHTPGDGQLTEAERRELLQLLGSTGKEVIETAAMLDDAAWSYKPTPEKWSVGQVVEHLLVVEHGLVSQVKGAMEAAPDPEWAAKTLEKTAVLRTTLADRSQTFQAPEPVQPKGEMTRREIMQGFIEARHQTMTLVRETDVPLHAHTYESFAFSTLNARQGLLVVALHNQRHLEQINEVLADPGFPG